MTDFPNNVLTLLKAILMPVTMTTDICTIHPFSMLFQLLSTRVYLYMHGCTYLYGIRIQISLLYDLFESPGAFLKYRIR